MIKLLFLVLVLTITSFPITARAITASEAFYTVGGGALGGAVLGASTLPFYENMGDHKQNIWAGAAVGTVVGVIIAAASGFSETSESLDEEDAPQAMHKMAPKLDCTKPTTSVALGWNQSRANSVVAWSPIASFRF